MRFHLRRLPSSYCSSYWMIAVAIALVAISACRRGSPILDPTSRTPSAGGTISGTVSGPEGTSPVAGRAVHAINVDTGAVLSGKTNNAGGYTFKVAPGRYRVEVTLLPGESIVKRPDVLDVTPAALEVSADFTIGALKLSRPPIRLRNDHALGAPSA